MDLPGPRTEHAGYGTGLGTQSWSTGLGTQSRSRPKNLRLYFTMEPGNSTVLVLARVSLNPLPFQELYLNTLSPWQGTGTLGNQRARSSRAERAKVGFNAPFIIAQNGSA